VELLDVDLVRVARQVTLGRAERQTAIVIACLAALLIVRGVVAAATPLAFDEAYYWQWSKNLAWGYYDHPPLVAFMIRAGTALFGDTSFGVRFVPLLLSIVATIAVWRSGAIVLGSEPAGALSALIFNAMPMIGVEMIVATPDAPQIAATAVLLYALAKLSETRNGVWWIAAGVACGFALLAKYTALFLGLGILCWLIIVPSQRHWLKTVLPYLGGLAALGMFLPVIVWNANHDWVSLRLQFGRIGSGGFTVRYLAEFLAGQVGLASPFIAILGVAGLVSILRSRVGVRSKRMLIAALMAPAVAYFIWHSLRGRVQGNWPSFLYPAFAIGAVAAITSRTLQQWWALRWSRRLAAPVALIMTGLIYAQAVWGIVPVVREPISRMLAVGIGRVANDIEVLRAQNNAQAVITTSYELRGWLSFYLPSRPPVIQVNERYRWLNEPEPPAHLFNGPLLYVTQLRNDQSEVLTQRFREVMLLAHIGRYRNGATFDEYRVYRVEGLEGNPFD
jgi:4-amino-4-deoxy-L-arabinose transferase-like glycosyltransferase